MVLPSSMKWNMASRCVPWWEPMLIWLMLYLRVATVPCAMMLSFYGRCLSRVSDFFQALNTFNFTVEGIRDEMRHTYDNRSEKWRDGDVGNQMQADIENLEEISSALEELVEKIEDLFDE
jgi:hypothetical protein